MLSILVRLICLAAGYCFGIFQTAYIYGRTQGIDIRTLGSGNAGTTNVLRNFGKKAGIIVFICDIGKCILAYYICSLLFGFSGIPGRLLGLYGAVGAVIGHCFPFYMQFRGGKGIACLVGLMAAFSPQTLLIGIIVTVLSVGVSYHQHLRRKLEELLDKTTDAQKDLSVTIRDSRVRGVNLSLPINDLLCIEAQKNNVAVSYLKDGELEKAEIQSTLSAVLEDLCGYGNIFQCHRSFIVNVNNISSAKGNSNGYTLELGGGCVTVPVSRSYVPKLRSFIA